MITAVLLFLLGITCLTLTISVLNPFVYICFVTIASVCLGLLLLANGLGFAGAVLIIVNAGAIAMVFLFVCMLSARNHVVYRRSDFFKNIFLLCVAAGFAFFCFYCYFISVFAQTNSTGGTLATLPSQSLLSTLPRPSFVLQSSLPEDFSLASHILILESNPSFRGFLPLIGIMLVITMVIAILVTQRTKPQTRLSTTLGFWGRRWSWDSGTVDAPGLEPRAKLNLFKWH